MWISVVILVGDKGFGIDVIEQELCFSDCCPLLGRPRRHRSLSHSIDNDRDFDGQSAMLSPDDLIHVSDLFK